jgi:hypothetical protein
MKFLARRTGLFIGSTFILNFIWEMTQSELGLYAGHGGDLVSAAICARAALGDVLIVGIIYAIMAVIYKTKLWLFNPTRSTWGVLVMVSASVAILVEWWGLETGRWAYSELMPTVPFLELGISPILQMVILVPLITLIVRK